MSYETARNNIQAHFASQWGSTTPVAYDNVPFTPPDDAAWVRLSVQNNTGGQESLGGPTVRLRRRGFVFVQIFTPEGSSPTEAMQLADAASAIFEKPNQRLATGERFSNVSAREAGVDAGWFQVNVRAEFQFDVIK